MEKKYNIAFEYTIELDDQIAKDFSESEIQKALHNLFFRELKNEMETKLDFKLSAFDCFISSPIMVEECS